MDFAVVGERVVAEGYSWFMAGVGLAFAGWATAAVWAEGRRPPSDDSPRPPHVSSDRLL